LSSSFAKPKKSKKSKSSKKKTRTHGLADVAVDTPETAVSMGSFLTNVHVVNSAVMWLQWHNRIIENMVCRLLNLTCQHE
jgi:hypothetical protein